VDVQAAVGSNLYADPIKDDGRWVTQTKLAEKTINGQEETSYQLIGATANKLLALIATYNGGDRERSTHFTSSMSADSARSTWTATSINGST
jgi:hypothetical protein